MTNLELEPIIQKLTPKLYQYAYALVPDELQAEQIVIDACSVYVLRDKNWLNSFDQELASQKERLLFKKTITMNLIKEVWNLAKKRSQQLGPRFQNPSEFKSFYELDLMQRSVLFLKDNWELKWEEIGHIHDAKKYQLLEKVYQAREVLLAGRMETQKDNDSYAR